MKSFKSFRSTKIVSTLGPASHDIKVIKSLMISGVNVFRLNFSHGSHEDHLKSIKHIRNLEKKLNLQIAILADLQGPKFRIGEMEDGILIKAGARFKFDKLKSLGNIQRVYLSHEEIYSGVRVNSIIMLDDGKLKFRVLKKNKNEIYTKVIIGGKLTSNKGLNLPDIILDTSPITLKDKRDLK